MTGFAPEPRTEDDRVGPLEGFGDRRLELFTECRLDGDKIPPAKAVQRLVQAWREMRKWR